VAALADRPVPDGFHAFRDPQSSGRVLYGTFSGSARSATAAAQGILGSLKVYFDKTPDIQTVARNDTDQQVQAFFAATIQTVPVLGVVGVELRNGNGSVSVIFDRPESLRSSFSGLRALLARSVPQGAADVALRPTRLADGSTISLPDGWRVASTGKGSVDLEGSRGETASFGAAAPVYSRVQRMPGMPANYVLQSPCCDPVRALTTLLPQISAIVQRSGRPPMRLVRVVEAQPTQWPNGQAAYILTQLNVGGRLNYSYNLVGAMPGYSDPWTYYTSGVAAPDGVFQNEFGTMLRIWKSYTVNPAVFQERLDNAVKNMNESWRLLREGMAEATRASLSNAEGWDQYIRGVQTIEHTGSGRQWEADNQSAQGLVDSLNGTGTRTWRIVPPSELIR
jgi:hypothetical protein